MSPTYVLKLQSESKSVDLASGFRMYFSGAVYLDNRRLNEDEVFEELKGEFSIERLGEVVSRFRGFFSIVLASHKEVLLISDIIRSRPLFYAVHNNQVFVSDVAENIRSELGLVVRDNLAVDEFLLTGYVTGSNTLYPEIKQVQAGEIVLHKVDVACHSFKLLHYYRFLHREPSGHSDFELDERLSDCSLQVFQRLVDYAAGRQIVVPLSGGYDSRLIVTYLKLLGYENVLCFSYGTVGNKESEYSKAVADALGFRWVFVEYTVDKWRKQWATSEAEKYKFFSSNHASLPHVQDWLAIKELRETGAVCCDAVVVPGHSGDFVAGSHIPLEVIDTERVYLLSDVVSAIIEMHYSNRPKSGIGLFESGELERRVLSQLDVSFDGTNVAFANLFEYWDWKERQAKYIANSIRVYELAGLDWWMPLWDRDFVEFWRDVPLSVRRGRSWFKTWIVNRYKEHASEIATQGLTNADELPAWYLFLLKVIKILPKNIVEPLRNWNIRRHRAGHIMAFEGLVGEVALKRYPADDFNIIGVYSDLYISNNW